MIPLKIFLSGIMFLAFCSVINDGFFLFYFSGCDGIHIAVRFKDRAQLGQDISIRY